MYMKGKGPRISKTILKKDKVESLKPPDFKIHYKVVEVIKTT